VAFAPPVLLRNSLGANAIVLACACQYVTARSVPDARRGGMVSVPSTERIVYGIITHVLNPQPETPEIESTQLA